MSNLPPAQQEQQPQQPPPPAAPAPTPVQAEEGKDQQPQNTSFSLPLNIKQMSTMDSCQRSLAQLTFMVNRTLIDAGNFIRRPNSHRRQSVLKRTLPAAHAGFHNVLDDLSHHIFVAKAFLENDYKALTGERKAAAVLTKDELNKGIKREHSEEEDKVLEREEKRRRAFVPPEPYDPSKLEDERGGKQKPPAFDGSAEAPAVISADTAGIENGRQKATSEEKQPDETNKEDTQPEQADANEPGEEKDKDEFNIDDLFDGDGDQDEDEATQANIESTEEAPAAMPEQPEAAAGKDDTSAKAPDAQEQAIGTEKNNMQQSPAPPPAPALPTAPSDLGQAQPSSNAPPEPQPEKQPEGEQEKQAPTQEVSDTQGEQTEQTQQLPAQTSQPSDLQKPQEEQQQQDQPRQEAPQPSDEAGTVGPGEDSGDHLNLNLGTNTFDDLFNSFEGNDDGDGGMDLFKDDNINLDGFSEDWLA